jgi:hypothetical protein
MRLRVCVLALASAGALAGVPSAAASAPAGPFAHAACFDATIGGRHRCIARGQYCARRYQRDYRRYDLSCSKLDYRGRYHLQ